MTVRAAVVYSSWALALFEKSACETVRASVVDSLFSTNVHRHARHATDSASICGLAESFTPSAPTCACALEYT